MRHLYSIFIQLTFKVLSDIKYTDTNTNPMKIFYESITIMKLFRCMSTNSIIVLFSCLLILILFCRKPECRVYYQGIILKTFVHLWFNIIFLFNNNSNNDTEYRKTSRLIIFHRSRVQCAKYVLNKFFITSLADINVCVSTVCAKIDVR